MTVGVAKMLPSVEAGPLDSADAGVRMSVARDWTRPEEGADDGELVHGVGQR
jgi:hypothetical protein